MDRVNIAEAACEPAPAPVLREPPRPPDVSSGTILTLAAACGLLVANIYYAQPLIAEIAQSLGLATGAAGLIVTMSQIGYGVGLVFVVLAWRLWRDSTPARAGLLFHFSLLYLALLFVAVAVDATIR